MMLPIRIHTDIQVYICSTALTLLSGCHQLCHIRLISSFHCSTTLTLPIRIHTDIQVYSGLAGTVFLTYSVSLPNMDIRCRRISHYIVWVHYTVLHYTL